MKNDYSAFSSPTSPTKLWLRSSVSPPLETSGSPWKTSSATTPRLEKFTSKMMKCGARSVTMYARAFKAICDQLHVIGCPVNDKVHWFLQGLGSEFSSFSTAQFAVTPLPYFVDLISKAESIELFQKSMESSSSFSSSAAFTATNRSFGHANQRGASSRTYRGWTQGYSSSTRGSSN